MIILFGYYSIGHCNVHWTTRAIIPSQCFYTRLIKLCYINNKSKKKLSTHLLKITVNTKLRQYKKGKKHLESYKKYLIITAMLIRYEHLQFIRESNRWALTLRPCLTQIMKYKSVQHTRLEKGIFSRWCRRT